MGILLEEVSQGYLFTALGITLAFVVCAILEERLSLVAFKIEGTGLHARGDFLAFLSNLTDDVHLHELIDHRLVLDPKLVT